MIFTIPRRRGTDVQGSGAYGAPRGTRKHKGVDYAVKPGAPIYAAVSGTVTRLGWPYKKNMLNKSKGLLHLRLIEVRVTKPGFSADLVRYMYVEPAVTKNMKVERGDLLGTVQRLPYEGITQHVHVDVKMMVNQRRKHVDPEWYFEEYWG